MPDALAKWLPPDALNIVGVLFLSFLIGLEREERKAGAERYAFGGVRTFPLIGLIAYAVAFVSGGDPATQVVGFVVVGVFLLVSYWHKVASGGLPGVTSEMAGLITYVVGALVYHRDFWIATTISVVTMLLLEMKAALEGLTRRIAPDDIFTFTKFLLLTAVILPILPDAELTAFQLNPFKTWLVVVAVSAVSYASYVLQRWTRGEGGVLLASVLGGAYSSTVTTVVLSRRASGDQQPHLFSGAILMACGMMYLRLAVLLGIFNRGLMLALGPPFLVLGGAALVAGWLWSRRSRPAAGEAARQFEPSNPLELRAAFLFAALFVAMLVATHLAIEYLGNSGVYSLAAIMGVTDVDPFIMGMTQAGGASTSLDVAAKAILIAAASNNAVKGVYAWYLASPRTGRQSLLLLAVFAALGLIPLVW
ncbi:MAG TPA: MgtC/SapB family protein [Burkholderiaceae bacterium]